MPLIILLLTFYIICNWLFTETFVFLPIHLLDSLTSLLRLGLLLVLFLIVSWCFGD